MTANNGHGGDIFALPEEEREKILDFSININPLGMSPRGKKAMLHYFDRETTRYPDTGCRDLKAAMSRRYGIAPAQITCGNGATELMYAFIRGARPSAVYVPAPAFSEYRLAAEAQGVPVRSFPLDRANHFRVSSTDFLSHIEEGAVLFLGNPNNPDGQLLESTTFFRFAKAAEEKKGWLVIDESFIDFAGEGSCRGFLASHPQVIVMMSLTKFYAVPGLRIGAAFSSEAAAALLQKELYPWNVNGPVQLYMKEALSDENYAEETRDVVEEERRRMALILSGHPALTVYPGTVNFLLLQLRNGESAAQLQEKLTPYHIKIRECANYEGLDDSFFRVAVKRREDNDRLMDALRKVLKE